MLMHIIYAYCLLCICVRQVLAIIDVMRIMLSDCAQFRECVQGRSSPGFKITGCLMPKC